MPIRYCLNCSKTAYEEETYYENGHPYCPRCHYLLYYFGRESGQVSSQDVLKAYDASHPFDPIADFEGKVVNFETPKPDINLMECEALLSQNPANEKALYFMGLHYKSQNDTDKALVYLETLEGVNPYHAGMNRELGDLYVKMRYFPEAIACFERLLDETDRPMEAMYNLGISYYFNKQYERAKVCFNQVKEGKDPIRAKQAKLIMSQLI